MLGQYAAGLAFDRGIGTDRYWKRLALSWGSGASGPRRRAVQIGNIHFLGDGIGVDHARAYFWWQIA